MSVDTDDESRSSQLGETGSADAQSLAVLDPLLNSYALQATAVGLFVIVIAYVMDTGIWPEILAVSGVWSALLAIWGTGVVLAGVAIHVAVTLSRRGSRG